MSVEFQIMILIVLQVATIVILATTVMKKAQKNTPITKPHPPTSATCTVDTCGALDPVNEPEYNMGQVAKQSILLEEHIAEKNKYCQGCIVKHFLHIIGLVEEAVWLAGNNLDQYPLLEDSPTFYQSLFDTWRQDRQNDETKKLVLDALRGRRRELVEVYYLQH